MNLQNIVILVICFIALYFCIILLIRNREVFNYRDKLLESATSIEQLRYIGSVSYDEMVLKFWRPIKSFYKDFKGDKENG